jgi:hypothetical protein
MRSHVDIFDSFILRFAADSRGKRSEESWGEKFSAARGGMSAKGH